MPAEVSSVEMLYIPVSPGELLDRITILDIKQRKIADEIKLGHIRTHLQFLVDARDAAIPKSIVLDRLVGELSKVNEALWDVENRVRICDREGNFGTMFVELARSIYRLNDHRASLKHEINCLLHSSLTDEKSYGNLDRQDDPLAAANHLTDA